MTPLTVIIGPTGVTCPHCRESAPMSRCVQFLVGHAACNAHVGGSHLAARGLRGVERRVARTGRTAGRRPRRRGR